MAIASGIRILAVLAAAVALVFVTGCSTPTPPPAPAPVETPAADLATQYQAQFQKLVDRLLHVEPALTQLLDDVGFKLEKPAQIAFERELLAFLTSEPFAATLRSESFFTSPTLLQQFTPETAAALKTAGLDRPLLNLTDDLAGLSAAINETATISEDGRALQRVFGLVHREVLPTLVEIRALVTEELLDTNEAATLTQKVEEQLQSINEQLASLQSRALSVSSPSP
jgi:hypothetical protein